MKLGPRLRLPRLLRAEVRPSSALLVTGIALAACAVGLQTDWGRRWPPQERRDPPAAPAPQAAGPEVLAPFALAAADPAAPAETRPLFVPTRRPAPPPPPVAPVAVMRKGQFALLGTSVERDGGGFALLKEQSSGRTLRVRRGEQVNGITLERVETARVVLAQGGDSEELFLKARTGSEGAPASVGAPAQSHLRAPGADAVLRFVPPSHGPAPGPVRP